MVLCDKCDYSFDASVALGGSCPRCLLLGVDEEIEEPGTEVATDSAAMIEVDEVAAELPGFEIEERIGHSAMSTVWRARERVLDRCVAIKLLRNLSHEASFVERFTREARVMARLHHPNIVVLHSFGRTRSNHCYLVMELVEGTDLAHLLRQKVLSLPQILAIIIEVCEALRHAHELGFVHRDVKPGNVLIDARGHVKMADFGLARLTRANDPSTISITKLGYVVGTPHYISPEQASGNGHEDHRADIFSLGVMLYEMITGELPRGVFSPPSSKFKTDKRLDRIVMRAMQEEPEKRYQSVRELSAEIQKIREAVDPVVIAERAAMRRANRKRLIFEMVLAIVVALLLGIMLAWYSRGWLDQVVGTRSKAAAQAPVGTNAVPAASPLLKLITRLQPEGLTPGARFGERVVVWEDWMVVSAPHDKRNESAFEASEVFVFKRSKDKVWTLHQVIAFPALAVGQKQVSALAMRDGLIVVGMVGRQRGEQGTALIYELGEDDQWLLCSHALPLPESRGRLTGNSVATCAGAVAVLSAERSEVSILFFRRDQKDEEWHLTSIPTGDRPVAVCSNEHGEWITAAMGLPESPGKLSAGVSIARAGSLSADVVSAPMLDGWSIPGFRRLSASGDYILVSSLMANKDAGLVWVLKRTSEQTFQHDGYLSAAHPVDGAEFGKSTSVSGDWCVVGTDQYGLDKTHRGMVTLFHRDGSSPSPWKMALELGADPRQGASDFGNAVELIDDELAVGAPNSGSLDRPDATSHDEALGAIFVYRLDKSMSTKR